MSVMSPAMVDPNSASTVAQSLISKQGAAATAAAATTSSSSASSASAAGQQISSSDFLTLLVTEMKNQDPTQPTDPNAYIQQLVGVNSLQQLIAINQDLTGTGSSSTTSATGGIATPAIPGA
jgi:flagellar basal-body rod modification protein FlgD